MRQCIGPDFLMLVPHLSPSELAVPITIQFDCIGEVAEGDVPLTLNVIVLNRQ